MLDEAGAEAALGGVGGGGEGGGGVAAADAAFDQVVAGAVGVDAVGVGVLGVGGVVERVERRPGDREAVEGRRGAVLEGDECDGLAAEAGDACRRAPAGRRSGG